jgi:hypothetical protein
MEQATIAMTFAGSGSTPAMPVSTTIRRVLPTSEMPPLSRLNRDRRMSASTRDVDRRSFHVHR